MLNYMDRILMNMERMKMLRDLALIDSDEETIYDRMTQLASKVIGTPVSLMSMVASDYQFFKSQVGVPDPWRSRRRTPISHAFCKHVVVENKPLIVTNAPEDERVKDNLGIQSLNIIGYLGIPLTLSDGSSLGSFCVTDNQAREWTQTEIDIMTELAAILVAEFETRAKVRIHKAPQKELETLHSTIEALIDSLNTETTQEKFLEQLKAAKEKHNLA